MTVDLALVFIITILSPKNGRTDGASEMVDVVFSFQRSYVRTTKGTPTGRAQ